MDDTLQTRLSTLQALLAALLAAVLAVGFVLDGSNYLVAFAASLAAVAVLGTVVRALGL
jgi:hypothetical protein